MSFRTALLSVVAGLLVAQATSCSDGTVRCLVSNCAGCCDVNGECQKGTELFACGGDAGVCLTCRTSDVCFQGTCLSGDGGVNPGTGGGGGGAGGGRAGTCSTTSCGGCCDAQGNCRGGITQGACGKGGIACVTCAGAQTCVNATCQDFTCPGCVGDGGVCYAGNRNENCGTSAGPCATCTGAQTCFSGQCTSGVTCGPANCSGCCDGNVCIAQVSDTQCGSNGFACGPCASGLHCNSGSCSTMTSTGGGAGGGGGSAAPCASSNCNGCCDQYGGCQVGDKLSYCGSGGDSCESCNFYCNPSLGVCL
jgi:hypothetical protein